MRKPKKPAKPDAPNVSPEISKTPLKADLDPGFIADLRRLSKAERQDVGQLIQKVCEAFGSVHAHRGRGLRDLGHGIYECRLGLKQRLIFQHAKGLLYFHTMGNHEDVKRFLKSHR